MKQIGKCLLFIICINILGLAVQANAIVQKEPSAAMNPGETSYTVEDYRKEKNKELTSDRSLMGINEDNLIINAIGAGIKKKQTQINLTPYVSYMVGTNYATNLYFEAMDKFPEIFYASPVHVTGSFYKDRYGKIVQYTLNVEYIVSISSIDSMVQTYNSKVKNIGTNYTNLSYGELENEYIVHDYILENCTYDKSSVIKALSHTSYGALVTGVAVCDGYAKAAKQLLNNCGIESGIVTNSSGDHAWNYVKIESRYYHLDLTWDDPIINSTKDSNETNYTHFNLSDTALSKVRNHEIPANVYPESTSTAFDFLRTNMRGNRYYSKKVGHKLYYTEYSSGNLRSMDLRGNNNTLISSGLDFYDFEGYKSMIYVDDYKYNAAGVRYNVINSFNLVSKKSKTEYVTTKEIVDIYKKGSQLFIKTEDGNLVSISIANREDVTGDGIVTILDIAKVAQGYNKLKTSVGYIDNLDINMDGIIDIYDICKVSLKIA